MNDLAPDAPQRRRHAALRLLATLLASLLLLGCSTNQVQITLIQALLRVRDVRKVIPVGDSRILLAGVPPYVMKVGTSDFVDLDAGSARDPIDPADAMRVLDALLPKVHPSMIRGNALSLPLEIKDLNSETTSWVVLSIPPRTDQPSHVFLLKRKQAGYEVERHRYAGARLASGSDFGALGYQGAKLIFDRFMPNVVTAPGQLERVAFDTPPHGSDSPHFFWRLKNSAAPYFVGTDDVAYRATNGFAIDPQDQSVALDTFVTLEKVMTPIAGKDSWPFIKNKAEAQSLLEGFTATSSKGLSTARWGKAISPAAIQGGKLVKGQEIADSLPLPSGTLTSTALRALGHPIRAIDLIRGDRCFGIFLNQRLSAFAQELTYDAYLGMERALPSALGKGIRFTDDQKEKLPGGDFTSGSSWTVGGTQWLLVRRESGYGEVKYGLIAVDARTRKKKALAGQGASLLPTEVVLGPDPVSYEAYQAEYAKISEKQEKNRAIAPFLNAGGFKLIDRAVTTDPLVNVAVSPTSVGQVLMMAMVGAEGSTRDALAQFLHIPPRDPKALGDWIDAAMPPETRGQNGVRYQAANSIWWKQGTALRKTYLAEVARRFEADSGGFRDSADGVRKINAWVVRRTSGAIPEAVRDLDAGIDLCLVNAVSFFGRWEDVFDKALTQPRTFHLSSSATASVPMMKQSRTFQYSEIEGLQIVSLPYQNSPYEMIILLPAKDSAGEPGSLSHEQFERATESLNSRKGVLFLPRFSIQFERDLADDLKALGLQVAFSDRANFSGIGPKGTKLSALFHKTTVVVDEEGTVAAASSILTAKLGAAAQTMAPFSMVVNRPFYFAICDQATRAIVFLGKVNRPEGRP